MAKEKKSSEKERENREIRGNTKQQKKKKKPRKTQSYNDTPCTDLHRQSGEIKSVFINLLKNYTIVKVLFFFSLFALVYERDRLFRI